MNANEESNHRRGIGDVGELFEPDLSMLNQILQFDGNLLPMITEIKCFTI